MVRRRPFIRRAVVAVLIALGAMPAYGFGHGPTITIWADGDMFVNTTLRDNQKVGAELVGDYLGRIAFKSTKKLTIKADAADATRAVVKAKFELRLAEGKNTVLNCTFSELRLTRAKADREEWFLTREGVALIETELAERDK